MTETINRLSSMMRSCYAYDSLSKENPYIKKFEKEMGTELFNRIYAENEESLKKNFKVVRGVYTDHEGCSYNELVQI